MTTLRFALFAALVVAAAAKCPGSGSGCSGHGTCGVGEMCTCEDGYQGLDCSERMCAYGLSWTIMSQGAGIIPGGRGLGGQHPYTECSSVGECDYSSGVCSCDDGFEGKGCRKRSCPNDCSSHGKCYDNYEFRSNFTALNAAQFNSQFRDFLATRQCVCDRGWKGQDCSERICPKGDDPVTDCRTDATGAAHEMIQRIYVRSVGKTKVNDCAAQSTCGVDATSCVGYYQCDHAAGHQFCSETTRWYANEAAFGDGLTTIGGAQGSHDHCGPAIGVETAGTYDNSVWGYIALKYTDMFGGVYKTRPILLSNERFSHQFFDKLAGETHANYADTKRFLKPNEAAQAHQQYGGLNPPPLLKDGTTIADVDLGTIEGGVDTATPDGDTTDDHDKKRGNILKLVHQEPGTDTTKDYDQIRSTRKLYVADRIRHALQSLPNFAIPSVNVTNYYIDHNSQKVMFTNIFDVTFTHHTNSGRQPLMECIYEHENACEGAFPRLLNSGGLATASAVATCPSPYSTTEGGDAHHAQMAGSECNKKYVGTNGNVNVNSCTIEEVHPGTKTYEENVECSNRGTCDTSSGICQCYDGHTGEACAQQTVFF